MSELWFITDVIADLKQRFPTSITIIYKGDSTVDLDTGAINPHNTEVVLEKAILLPEDLKLQFALPSEILQSTEIKRYSRSVLIDANDLNHDIPKAQKDQVNYNNQIYDIIHVINHSDRAYELLIREIQGS